MEEKTTDIYLEQLNEIIRSKKKENKSLKIFFDILNRKYQSNQSKEMNKKNNSH